MNTLENYDEEAKSYLSQRQAHLLDEMNQHRKEFLLTEEGQTQIKEHGYVLAVMQSDIAFLLQRISNQSVVIEELAKKFRIQESTLTSGCFFIQNPCTVATHSLLHQTIRLNLYNYRLPHRVYIY